MWVPGCNKHKRHFATELTRQASNFARLPRHCRLTTRPGSYEAALSGRLARRASKFFRCFRQGR